MSRTALHALRHGVPLAAVACLVLIEPALAQQPGQDLGKNLAGLIKSWLEPLVIVIGGGAMFAAFAKRNTGQLVTVSLVCTVVGGFVFADDQVREIIEGIWRTVSGAA